MGPGAQRLGQDPLKVDASPSSQEAHHVHPSHDREDHPAPGAAEVRRPSSRVPDRHHGGVRVLDSRRCPPRELVELEGPQREVPHPDLQRLLQRQNHDRRPGDGPRGDPHDHELGEEFIVLDGVFSDNTGDFGAGTYVRNPVGSRHAPWSKPGTTIFVKLAQFDPADQSVVRLDTESAEWIDGPVDGIEVLPLHSYDTEQIRLVRLEPDTKLPDIADEGGTEIFVVQGSVTSTTGRRFEERDWLRLPPGTPMALSSEMGATLYIKTGHLLAHIPQTLGESHD